MKKTFLLFICIHPLANNAQNLTLTDTALNGPAAHSYTIQVAANDLSAVSFRVTNTGNTSIRSRVKRTVLNTTSGQQTSFDYGYVMYAPATNLSTGEMLGAGQSLPDNSGREGLVAYFYPNSIVGSTMVRYTLYDSLNHSDSVNVSILYNAIAPNAVQSPVSDASINMYPNPASQEVTFRFGMADEIWLLNSTGQIATYFVRKDNEKELRADISQLLPEVYQCSFRKKGKTLFVKGLVITR